MHACIYIHIHIYIGSEVVIIGSKDAKRSYLQSDMVSYKSQLSSHQQEVYIYMYMHVYVYACIYIISYKCMCIFVCICVQFACIIYE